MVYTFRVVQLANGNFWSPHNPVTGGHLRIAMNWGERASDEKIARDLRELCRRGGVQVPLFQVRTVIAKLEIRVH